MLALEFNAAKLSSQSIETRTKERENMPTMKKQRMLAGKAIRAQSAEFVNVNDGFTKRIPFLVAMKLARVWAKNHFLSPISVDSINEKDSKSFFKAEWSPFCECCVPSKIMFTWHEDCKPVARWEFDCNRSLLRK